LNDSKNQQKQTYKGIELVCIQRNYINRKAKRYTLGGTNQNVWIPTKHLEADGTIKASEDIDYVFRKAVRRLEIAGYTDPIVGIKRRSTSTPYKESE
jgi:hypothetical protein